MEIIYMGFFLGSSGCAQVNRLICSGSSACTFRQLGLNTNNFFHPQLQDTITPACNINFLLRQIWCLIPNFSGTGSPCVHTLLFQEHELDTSLDWWWEFPGQKILLRDWKKVETKFPTQSFHIKFQRHFSESYLGWDSAQNLLNLADISRQCMA